MGLAGLYGSTAAGAARGLALRMDHGSQYLSDHFTNQIKLGHPAVRYAFVAEPQTNGVAERFNRTLKEQIIHGRIYRNIAELRDAVRDFVELYNAQWIVEKNGYLSPAHSSSGVARRDLNQARRVRQTCVQGTGCATPDPTGFQTILVDSKNNRNLPLPHGLWNPLDPALSRVFPPVPSCQSDQAKHSIHE